LQVRGLEQIVGKSIHKLFQSLIHQGKIARVLLSAQHPDQLKRCFNPLFIREKLQVLTYRRVKNLLQPVSIPYSSGKNCKKKRKLRNKKGEKNEVSIPYSSGKNCKLADWSEMDILILLGFQSLIHQGKIARSLIGSAASRPPNPGFNPLFIREKLQVWYDGPR